MDNNEHIIPEQYPEQTAQPTVYDQPAVSSEPASQPSPFANSPYVAQPAQQPYRPYNPAPAASGEHSPAPTPKEPKQKGVRGGHLVLAVGLMALIMITGRNGMKNMKV